MQSVIVIGGSGFLGTELVSTLLKKKYRVYVTQNKTIINVKPRLVVINGGINAITVKRINEINPVAIYHCGRPTFARFRKYGRKLAAIKANWLNRILLKRIKYSGTKAPLLFASGSLAYGNSNNPHDESANPNPISYAKQYLYGEKPILEAVKLSDPRVMVIRFPWLLGDGSWFSWFYKSNIIDSNSIPLFGDGSNKMSIIDLSDAAELLVKYAESDLLGNVYNIFSPLSITQYQFLQLLKQQSGSVVVDNRKLYSKGLEAAVNEAFTSSIMLKSKYMSILNKHSFIDIDSSLKKYLS